MRLQNLRQVVDGLNAAAQRCPRGRQRCPSLACAGGFPGVECVQLHAVQVVEDVLAVGTDIVLVHRLRRIWNALLLTVKHFALGEDVPATSGERVKAFEKEISSPCLILAYNTA